MQHENTVDPAVMGCAEFQKKKPENGCWKPRFLRGAVWICYRNPDAIFPVAKEQTHF